MRLLVTGNHDWLVPAGLEERRFAVLDVGEACMQDHDYFGAIIEEMNNGGREALSDYLLKFDLRINLRKIPKTKALLDQKTETLSAGTRLVAGDADERRIAVGSRRRA